MAWKEMQGEWKTYTEIRAGVNSERAQEHDDLRVAEQTARIAELDRFLLNRLLFDIAGSLDSLSFCYRKILEMQEQRARPSQPGPARR